MIKFVVLVLIPVFVKGAEWDYDMSDNTQTGPAGWAEYISNICGNSKQSPIDIITADATTNSTLGGFTLSDYDETSGVTLTLTNDGHGATVSISGGSMSVSGGDLGATYNLEQFHFHWGSVDSQGSEHTVDGTMYPLEMHLVHYKADYSNFTDAAMNGGSDALAVFGFFFEVSDSDNSDLDNVLGMLTNVTDTDSTVELTAFAIQDLFGDAVDGSYWRYSGSLTTPNCHEIVVWTVFEKTIKISSSQLAKLRTIEDKNGDAIEYNYRPVQSVGDRTVKYYTEEEEEEEEEGSSSSSNLGSVSLLALAYLLTKLV